ncbi:FIST signal transduction protein [Polyangium spumosum]|uniref:Histidine kinase n=1 Tax=Polyangium spumosum TaxID=889282 RepID=A0A6N7Q0G9_9BACT|nr:FIST N-terminal domain-containing protein [Polyangium spumosum]MRG96230.1 hypothetical protein [Polyangium spumosum]
MRAATASIVHEDAERAGREVIAELLDELGGKPDLVLVFASARYEPEALLRGIWSRLPEGVELAGCSSCAEIGAEEALSGSVTVMGIQLGSVSCATLVVEHIQGRSREAGRELGERARSFEPGLLIVLPDGIGTNGAQLLEGLQEVVGRRFPIVGGVAADELRFQRTWELRGREVLHGGAVAVALKGDISFFSAAKGGWQPVGAARTCTRVENGTLLLELDGRPALGIYKDFLGERAANLETAGIEFPLGVVGGMPGDYQMSDEQILVVRAVQGVDEARQGLLLSGEIQEGARVRLTRGTKEDLIQSAAGAVEEATRALPGASLALFFDCAGRKVVLGPRYKDEVEAAFARLGDVPRIGFYTYGELSPVQGVTLHHDETFTMMLLRA